MSAENIIVQIDCEIDGHRSGSDRMIVRVYFDVNGETFSLSLQLIPMHDFDITPGDINSEFRRAQDAAQQAATIAAHQFARVYSGRYPYILPNISHPIRRRRDNNNTRDNYGCPYQTDRGCNSERRGSTTCRRRIRRNRPAP